MIVNTTPQIAALAATTANNANSKLPIPDEFAIAFLVLLFIMMLLICILMIKELFS